MKITSFQPLIITSHAKESIELFEALGFERRHQKENINNQDITGVVLKDANGFHVVVVQANGQPQDITSIRMNVDDLEEAIAMLEARGFKNINGDKITDTGSSRATMMVSPSGFSISVAQHIK